MATLLAWTSLKLRWTLIFVIALLVTMIPLVSAEPSNPKAKEKEAKKSCLAGSYQKGIELLAELYADTNNPTYIYNQARCYQQNDRPEQALSRFREYLRKNPKLTDQEKADLDSRMGECQSLIAEMRSQPVTAHPASSTKAENSQGLSSTEPPILINPYPSPASAHSPGRGLRIAGVVAGAAGLVAIGTGVGFGMAHDKLVSDYTRDKQSSIDRYKTVTWVCYGVGAAALTTGSVLYILGWYAGKADTQNFALLPAIFTSGATLSLRGGF